MKGRTLYKDYLDYLVFALWFVSVQITIWLKWHLVCLCWFLLDFSVKQTMWNVVIVNNGHISNVL